MSTWMTAKAYDEELVAVRNRIAQLQEEVKGLRQQMEAWERRHALADGDDDDEADLVVMEPPSDENGGVFLFYKQPGHGLTANVAEAHLYTARGVRRLRADGGIDPGHLVVLKGDADGHSKLIRAVEFSPGVLQMLKDQDVRA